MKQDSNSLATKIFLLFIFFGFTSCNQSNQNPDIKIDTSLRPFSPYILMDDGELYISGHIAPGANGKSISIEEETKGVMEKLGKVLKENNYDYNDLVRCSVFLTDINDFHRMNQVYASFFKGGRYPTRNTVEVSKLANGARIEISGIAKKKVMKGQESENEAGK